MLLPHAAQNLRTNSIGLSIGLLLWSIVAALGGAPIKSSPAADTIPAPPVAAAASMNVRREMSSKSFFMRCSGMWSGLAKLEHRDGACLRHVELRPLNLVDAVLQTSRVKIPARRDGDVLFPIDLKGYWNADRSRGEREAPQLIAGTRVKRSEQSIGSSPSEENVSARDQQGGPKHRLEIVLPDSLAGVQIPSLEFSQVIGSAGAGTDRSENALDLIPDINPLRMCFWDSAFREERADVVVRGDVQEFGLRAPRLGWPVLAATKARAERGALRRARSLGLVDGGTTGLRVNRREHVVVGKRERVEEVESIAIQYPQIAVPTRVRGGLRKPSVNLGFDLERCRYFIPVPAVVRRVLMETFYPSVISIKRERRVRIQIVAGPVVRDPRAWIPGAPVRRVCCRVIDPGNPSRSAASFICLSCPGLPTRFGWRGHSVRLPESF